MKVQLHNAIDRDTCTAFDSLIRSPKWGYDPHQVAIEFEVLILHLLVCWCLITSKKTGAEWLFNKFLNHPVSADQGDDADQYLVDHPLSAVTMSRAFRSFHGRV